MRLPNVDLELTYWRLRRRSQRLRSVLRAHMSRARAEYHLRYLHRTGALPEKPEPEDTLAFRGLLWAAIIGTAFVIGINTIGVDEFRHQVDVVMALGRAEMTPAAPAAVCRDGATVDFDADQAHKRPVT